MKLRYLTVFDENGRDNTNLQYWDEEKKRWINVEHFRCSYKEEEAYNLKEG